jgi:lysophospholipase L1-like esterase
MVTPKRWMQYCGSLLGLMMPLGCEQAPERGLDPVSVPSSSPRPEPSRPPLLPTSAGQPQAPGAAPAWLGEYVDQDPELAGAGPATRRPLQRGTKLEADTSGSPSARADTGPQAGLPGPRTSAIRAYPQNVSDRPVPRVGDEPWKIDERWHAQHERLVKGGRRAEAKLVFLGDSITEAWRMAPAYKHTFAKYVPLNLGLSGDHTQHLLWRIEHGALDGLAPEVVVVLIGINNLGGGFSPAQTVSGIQAVIAAVQVRLAGTPIVLLGILPARPAPDDPLRHKVAEANRLLAAQAGAGRVAFHDVGQVLQEPDGTISNAVLRDYLHPTAAGYERLSAAVLPLIEPFVQ